MIKTNTITVTKNKRILIVEVNWLGDVLFSTAAIRALRTMYPESHIGCLVPQRCQEVLVGNPHIDELIILDEENIHKGLWGKIALIRLLKTKRFDTVFLFHRSFTRTLICWLAGIPRRIGYATAKRRIFLTEAIEPPDATIHRAAHYLYIVTRQLTHDTEALRSDFFIDDRDTAFVHRFLEEKNIGVHEPIVVMHPAGNWPAKRWPKHYFAELADEVIMRYGCKVIFTGAEKERRLIDEIIASMEQKAMNLCGGTSLKQLGALFERSDLVISGDSGPLHIAVVLARSVIALFGPTAPSITGPLATSKVAVLQKGVDCTIPCYVVDCPDNRCMAQIGVNDVLDCIEKNQWLRIKK